MDRVDVRVRAPTARAWVASAVSVILTGELFSELRSSGGARFFNASFSDGEVTAAVAVLGAAAVASLVWLALLYLRPGRLSIDVPRQCIERRAHRWGRAHTLSAQAADWRVRIVYFSSAEQARGTFKRLVLTCGADPEPFQEVLLFTDVDRPDDLLDGLHRLSESLGAYEVEIESAP